MLRLIARGYANKQAAAKLGIATKTVGRHVEHIYAKAGVATRPGRRCSPWSTACCHRDLARHGVNARLPARVERLTVARATLRRSARGRTRINRWHRASGRVETGRFDVRSADGTSIAVWVEGEGPALVMVHGSIADHTTFDPFVAVLRDDMTTVLDGSARLRRQRRHPRLRHRAGLRGRRRGDRRRRRTARADRSPCGAIRTAPTARWVAPPSPPTSTTSCCTNRASASRTRRAPSTASRPRSPGAIMTPPSPPCSSTSWR